MVPRISIVTPSYNQGQFLEEAMRSVLDQNYPDLEYIVIDGNSDDGSVETIERYKNRLAYWTSESDEGQNDAINKGFLHATGEIMAWLNADDKYMPWAFEVVGEIFKTFPHVEWLTTLYPFILDERGGVKDSIEAEGFNKSAFYLGRNLAHCPGTKKWARHYIQQESTFWRRSLWEKAGGEVEKELPVAGDFELWARFWQHANLYAVAVPLGGFRVHGAQKAANHHLKYCAISRRILQKYGRGIADYLTQSFHLLSRSIPPEFLKFIPWSYETKIIKYRSRKKQWEINTRYFV